MSKKIIYAILITFIVIASSCARPITTLVYLDVNKVIVYQNLEEACSSGQSTGKTVNDIIHEIGDNFVSIEGNTICLKAIVRKEYLVTSYGVSNTLIDVYEIPETTYYLRVSK